MNGIYWLNMPTVVEHFHKLFPNAIVGNGNAGFAFMSNEFQKAIVVGIAQNRYVAKLAALKLFIIVEEAIHDYLIALKNIECGLA